MTHREKYRRLILGVFVLVGAGCTSYESKLYEGKVVDEQGAPIQTVSLILCYVGWAWDWSMAGGFPLVIDHVFCSDPVVTDQSGSYMVDYAGPPSTYIIARHPDWIQTRNFLAKDNRVVLVRRELHQQRLARKEEEREKAFRKRRPGESGSEYYCRVVRKRSSKIELIYHGQRIKISDNLLIQDGKAIFALTGPYDAVHDIANDLIIGEIGLNGVQPLLGNIAALPETTSCDNKMYFIGSTGLGNSDLSALLNADDVKIEVPGLRAIFAIKTWKLE